MPDRDSRGRRVDGVRRVAAAARRLRETAGSAELARALGAEVQELFAPTCALVVLPGATLRLTQAAGHWREAAGTPDPAPAGLVEPIQDAKGEPLGRIALDGTFDAEDAALLSLLAQAAGAAAERIELSERLRWLEQRYFDFRDIASDWLWETDERHRFRARNDPQAEVGGLPAAAVVGRTRWELAGADPKAPTWAAHIADMEAHREFREFEYGIARPDGGITFVRVSGRPYHGPDGRFLGYRGVATDVTSRRELEAAYRQMFEHNPNPMWIYDLETFAFLAVNDAAVARYGYSREEFARMRLEDIRPPEDVERMRTSIAAQSPTWTSVGVWRHLTKDGRVRQVEMDTYRTEFAGRPAVTVLVRDVTERLEAEARLAETEERLRQAQKLESLGQLTGGVAHDFNNLLTVILGNLELIRENPATPASLGRSLAAIQRGAERGADLTRHLLAFARRQALDPRPTDVNALLQGLRNLLPRVLGETISLRVVPAADLRTAMVDAGQLEAALLNLALNARDAMPEGGKLTIETRNGEIDAAHAAADPDITAGDYVLVTVSDTGVGMSPDVRARAFDPFFTTKQTGKGSGLGLSMVYGFIKQSGGHVKLYSEPGHGTAVNLYLPCADAPQASAPAQPPATGGRETILVVEDDEMVRTIAVDQLTSLGYRVLAAETGATALKVLETAGPVDLLFTDMVMPGGMNGRELAEQAHARWPGLKLLFTSGYTEDAILQQAQLDPNVRLLQKPYRRQDLAARVREALGG